MRLGIWTPAPQTVIPDEEARPGFEALTKHGGGVDGSFLYAVSVLKRAEELGFDVTLIAQRYLGPDLDAWMLASALATQTTSIQLMAAVQPGIMDPCVVAKMGATIDRISGGRFCVNVVNGSRAREFHIYGKWIEHTETRYQRMQEFIEVLKGMWTEDDFTFHGNFFDVEHGTLPTKSIQFPHPRIFAASQAIEGMNVIADHCDTWFVNYDRNFREYDNNLRRIVKEVSYMEARTRELGRRISYGINACVILGDTDEEAEAKADAHLEMARSNPLTAVGAAGIGACLVGSRRRIVERIRRYQEIGIDLLMLQMSPVKRGLEEFGEQLIPDIRKH